MNITRFPTKLPSPHQLDLPQAQLVSQLQALSGLSLAFANQIMTVTSAPELAAVVRDIARSTAEAATGWNQISETIKRSWGIGK